MMASSYFTFDLDMTLINIQCAQSLKTGHAHVQISGLYYYGTRSYTILNDRG